MRAFSIALKFVFKHRCPEVSLVKTRWPWFRWGFFPFTSAIYFSKRPPMFSRQIRRLMPPSLWAPARGTVRLSMELWLLSHPGFDTESILRPEGLVSLEKAKPPPTAFRVGSRIRDSSEPARSSFQRSPATWRCRSWIGASKSSLPACTTRLEGGSRGCMLGRVPFLGLYNGKPSGTLDPFPLTP